MIIDRNIVKKQLWPTSLEEQQGEEEARQQRQKLKVQQRRQWHSN